MKIIISYPPVNTEKGSALLAQNRQFQWFKAPTYIYPVVPAQAATLLKQHDFDVRWNDCIAENRSFEWFLDYYKSEQPDVLAMETKTPVIEYHWNIINTLKKLRPECKIALFGDHVTALPEESFGKSQVDYVLTGGDYDFLLLNLAESLKSNIVPQKPGIWYRENGNVKNTGAFVLDNDLNDLPFIDRDLTQWRLYSEKNGNFKKTPGTYIMAGRDCWHHKCTFCSWTTLYPKYRVRSVENVLDEIGMLIENYKVKEIFDDSGSFPKGDWLRRFCTGVIERGYNKKVIFGCNMVFGALSFEDYKLMKEANFRFLLFGLESANQETLTRINKSYNAGQITESIKLARKAGLFPHVTIMFGYPWETYEDAMNTFNLGRNLLLKGYAYTMQATIVIPYPGTPLYDYCRENGLLVSDDYKRFDMKEPVMKIPFDNEKLLKITQDMYRVSYHPEFIMRKLLSIRDIYDVRYFYRAGKQVLGHVFDFRKEHLHAAC